MSDDIVKLEAGEFRWEDVPGKGRCLVPVKQTVTEGDVQLRRRYWNLAGTLQRFVRVHPPRGEPFYTVLDERRGFCCSGGVAKYSAAELADHVNSGSSHGKSFSFGRWLEPGELTS